MAYSSYVNNINTKKTTIKEFYNSTSKIDLDTIWEGQASTKQRENLTSVHSELNTQLSQLSSLNDAMTNIDEYDKIEKEIQNYRDQLNSLSKDDKDYASKYTEISEKIRELTDKKKELKAKIERELNSITTSYSTKLSNIEKTEVQKTLDLLKSIEEKFAKLKFEYQLSSGYKTNSSNSGAITLDKQGTIYDKEPTPGKAAQKLHVYHNGVQLYDDAEITMKKGDTIRLTVNLTDNCGEVTQLTRTSASGQGEGKNDSNHWKNWFHANSEPFVDRYDKSTFVNRDNFDWVITADQVTNGYVTLSQTTFHSTNQGSEFKSMYRIKVRVIE